MAGQVLFRLVAWISPWKVDAVATSEYAPESAPSACGGLAPVVQIHDVLQDDIKLVFAQNGLPVEAWPTTTVGAVKGWLRAAAPSWDAVEAHVKTVWGATNPGDPAAPGLGMVLQGLKMLRETAPPSSPVLAIGETVPPAPSVTTPVTPVSYTEHDRQNALAQPEDLDE